MPASPTFNGTLTADAFTGDAFVIGSTTASANTNLTIVGSSTSPISIRCERIGVGTDTYNQAGALMTSNSSPSPYVASASSEYGAGYEAYKAFNRVNSVDADRWLTGGGTSTGWLKLDCGVTTTCMGYGMASFSDATQMGKDWIFAGSPDSSSWTTLDTQTNQTSWVAAVYHYYPIASSKYRYYRLTVTANNGHGSQLNIWEFVLLGVVKPSTAMHINSNGIVMVGTNTAYGTSNTYLLQINGSSVGDDWVLKPSSSQVKTDLPGIATTEVLDITRNSDAHKFYYKDKVVDSETTETKAFEDYAQEDEQFEYELFKEVHENKYIEGELGSQSVNTRRLKNDFRTNHKNNKAVEWNDGMIVPDKTARRQLAKAYLEMDKGDSRNNTVNYGIKIDRNCPPEILDANGLPSMAKWQGFNFVAIKGLVGLADNQNEEIKSLKAIVGSLTSRLQAAGIP